MPNRLAARNGGRWGLAALVAILLLGLGLRVGEAWDGRAPVYDARAYAAIARNLDEGNGFTVGAAATQPSSDYSPGLPLFVAGLYKVTGGVHERLARLVLAAIGTLAPLFTYLLARRLIQPVEVGNPEGDKPLRVDPRAVVAGLIAALVVAIYPATIEYTGMLMTEPLAATLLVGAVLGLLWAGDDRGGSPVEAILGLLWAGAKRGGDAVGAQAAGSVGLGPSRSVWRWLVPGLTLGALALVRPEYLAIGLGLAVLVLLHEHFAPRWLARSHLATTVVDNCERVGGAEGGGAEHGGGERGGGDDRRLANGGWRRPALVAAVVALGIVVVVAPWTVRNAFALDRFVTVSTGGGQVLFAGTYLPSDGNPEEVGAHLVEEHPGIFGPHAAQNLRLEQILARYGERVHPELEPDKALSKLGKAQLEDDVLHHTGEYAEFVATKIGRVWSHGPRAIMRTPVWEALHWALLGLGLLGLAVLAYGRRWEALLIGAIFLAVTVISALLVGSPRRILVLVPLLAACAGFALARLASLRKGAPGPT